jgi:hypothetical protein
MKRLLLTITGLSLVLPIAASAADTVQIGNVVTSATLCEGVRLDRVMTYSQFLHEYALDKNIQAQLTGSTLTERKFEAYVKQSLKVRRGQTHLCGSESTNWQD